MPDPRVIRLVMDLRRRGLSDPRVLSAIERVDRAAFMPPGLGHLAFADQSVPIACGQTMCAPSLVARMSEALAVRPEHRVLEVGTGSGYHTGVLGRLSGDVLTIERWGELLETAKAALEDIDVRHVRFRHGDGAEGWEELGPYDRILVTAAIEAPPERLAGQLKEGGVLVAPVIAEGGQRIGRFVKTAGQLTQADAGPCNVPPLARGEVPA